MTPTIVTLGTFVIYLLDLLWYLIVAQVILSWLVTFNVINLHNRVVRQIYEGLERILNPLYRPLRRILPDFGGIDFAPFIVILLILLVQRLIAANIAAYAIGA